MADTIKLPLVGQTKKSTAYMLGAVLLVVLGVGLYRSRKASSGSTPATPSDSSGQQPADQTGQGPFDGSGASGGYGGGANWPTSPVQPQGFTSNAQWAQAVEDYLVNTVHGGENADVIGAALGKYLTGQPLTSDQVVIVQQAIAFGGYPPVNGPSGHPPAYITQSSGSGGGGGGSLTAPGAPTVSAIDKHGATLHWFSVSGASHYVIYYKMNGSGTIHQAGTSGGTSFRIGYFKPGTHLTVWLNAVDSKGKQGPPSSSTSFATHH